MEVVPLRICEGCQWDQTCQWGVWSVWSTRYAPWSVGWSADHRTRSRGFA